MGFQRPKCKLRRNVLGARGIDRISITENNATTHGYPLYDGHGNCRAILTKNGTSYGTGNWRIYDVWGSVRSGSATGDPKSRYVASIGHVADDESSLTYMRARYYEPATGRFLSEDSVRDGHNWYIYCGNEPLGRIDSSGNDWVFLVLYSSGSALAWSLFDRLVNAVQISAEAYGIVSAANRAWSAWIGAEARLPVADRELAAKRVYSATVADVLAFGPPRAVVDVKRKAQATADAYAISLLISMWMFDVVWLN